MTAVDNARAACQERKERKVCPACLERMAAQDQEATMDHQAVREIAEKMASLDYREELAQQDLRDSLVSTVSLALKETLDSDAPVPTGLKEIVDCQDWKDQPVLKAHPVAMA